MANAASSSETRTSVLFGSFGRPLATDQPQLERLPEVVPH
jgi:hypothetical protein